MKFEDLIDNQAVLDAIYSMGFTQATEVQQQAIPLILEKKDLIVCAQTGTGKTASYLLPILSHISQYEHAEIRALIIGPTRELVMQIDQNLQGLSYFTNSTSIAIYGGSDAAAWDSQKKAIQRKADILIATPGRLLSHLKLGYLKMESLDFLILDEADRMLDMGFHQDILKIISYLPQKRQTLLFSATMPANIRKLANAVANNPESINLAISKPPDTILQGAYSVYNQQKLPLLKSLLTKNEMQSILLFVSTKKMANEIEKEFIRNRLNARAIHSDLEQPERESLLLDFRNKKIQILIATNILSRGIDIDDIELVVNYDVPQDAEEYVHRIGRTARAEKKGVALTFINPNEQWQFQKIEQLIDLEVFKIPVPEEIGETPKYDPRPMPGKFQKNRQMNGKKRFGGKSGKRKS